jgi:PAS domain S-box-containing protein
MALTEPRPSTRPPMSERIARYPWGSTSIGPRDAWPAALRTLVELMLASNQPMFISWGAQRTMLYNDSYGGILGAKDPDALGRDFLDVWHEIRDDLQPIVASAYGGAPVQMDRIRLRMERRGFAEDAWFSFFYSPVRADDGAVAGFFCGCSEITAQVVAEQRLADREARYHGVLENIDEAFVLLDPGFDILDVNRLASGYLGHPVEALVGRNFRALFPDAAASSLGRMFETALSARRSRVVERPITLPDGRRPWFEVRAHPVNEGLAVMFRDVSERRSLQEEAGLDSERVHLALDAGAIVGTWVWTVPDDCFIADARFAATFDIDADICRAGLPLEQVMDSIHPADVERVGGAVADALARGGPYRCEYRVRQRVGGFRWVEANGRVELDADGKPTRFPGVMLDIEHRRLAEAERDRATGLLRTFIEAVPGVVYAKDRDGRLVIGNRGVAQLLGLPPEEFLGRTDAEVLADPAEAEAVMRTDRRIMASGVAEQVEETIRFPDGSAAIWWSTKAPLRDESGEVVGLIGASVDITGRKRMEEALRLSEQRAALAMDVARLGSWSWDLRSGEITVDARCREICGLPGTLPVLLDTVRERIHPDDLQRVGRAWATALRARRSIRFSEEFRWIRPDGSEVWIASRVQVSERSGALPRTVVGTAIDVTERRQMVEALTLADRRKDEFLAMLAHELRNPLAPISGAAHLLGIAADDSKKVRHAAAIISRQVRHMTDLVDDLLDVSRVTRGLVDLEREPVDMRAVVAAAIEQVEPHLQARRHTFTTAFEPGSAVVLGDRNRLVQVISNLLNNAAKYTPQGGRIELGVACSGDRVRVHVTDNGIGIEATLLPHVFDLFTQAERTPDRAQGGLGIGLALVRSIARLHGGDVVAESAGTNAGSTFALTLPRAAAREVPRYDHAFEARAGAPKDILVVDDNVDAATTLAEVLRAAGHRVATAADGSEALQRAGERARWDVIVLDIGLPDMTGYELAAKLRELAGAGEATLVALTGYGHAHDHVLSRSAGFHHHLVKPVDFARIQRILAGA